VSPALLQRQAALAAAALLATLGVLALGNRSEEDAPLNPGGPVVRWESAVVGILRPEAYAQETTCGTRLDSGTLGVVHPVLPCGVDLVLSLADKEVRTEVVDHAPVGGGREFDLTQALAEELGVHGRQTIRWRFAG
jgi:hypothetical protein